MDTTETYVKMCQKAEEIQAEWKPQDGDWTYGSPFEDGTNPRVECFALFDLDDWEWKLNPHIWLPRQDQLQEMVCVKFKVMAEAVQWLYSEIAPWPKEPSEYYRSFTSFEQIWLAFVMKEKYHKTWNGEDWVSD